MSGRPCRGAAAAFAGVAAAAVVLAGAGCATYVASNVELRTLLAAGDWQRALARVDAKPGGTDRLLELLQRGHVLHYAGEFEESNASFQRAEDLSAALYTRSVSQTAASLIVNDTTIDYRGKPHELAMVQFYRAFNYLSLGDADAAQVEARKATLRLADAVEATLREIERPEDREAARGLRDSGFLHWFSGLLFEANGSANDAFVAYRNAARAYLASGALTGLAPPPQLGRDLERIGLQYGFRTEVEALRTAWPELIPAVEENPASEGGGEVVFVLETGWVATRDQVILNVPILDIDEKTYGSTDEWARELVKRSAPGWSPGYDVEIEYWLTVAMPVMAPPITGRVVAARITGGGAEVASVPADDLSRRAAATFEAERGQILFKTLLRALVKYAATRTAEHENETAGLIVNLLGVLSERADTRCWLTLPDRLSVARLRLPAGRHELLVEYFDAAGAVVVSQVEIVEVTDGGWLFLNRRPF